MWDKSFHNTTAIETIFINGTRNNPNLTKELVRRSPRIPKQKTTTTE
jgi:hypothetical protein